MLPIDEYDGNFDKLARMIAEMCDEDSICLSKVQEFAPDTLSLIINTFEAAETGGICKELVPYITQDTLRNAGLIIGDWYLRTLYPAVFYRINRCSEADISALPQLFEVRPQRSKGYAYYSRGLDTNIITNELIGGEGRAW
ncbi:hypothetical protein [Limisalsivibrio acetivorans]|uniref:hypothetical protein n=1 Tax=Limisalsivibrio acetivorans TaxID=1304888 RepID=UPI0003B5D16F|nr:hypothetical protein [Limisalsivibrio acetivorans]